jgi:WD40 repeat protein
MDFTDKLAYSGPQPVFSPDSKLMASADGYRLVVRDAASLAVVSLCSCLDRIESISWSPDSDHILCALFKRATVQVFCVSDSDWACNIAEGPAGIVAARWTPDGQHILLTADFGVRLSAWSLVDQSCAYLRGPKHAQAGLAFSPDGSLLAVAHVSAASVG